MSVLSIKLTSPFQHYCPYKIWERSLIFTKHIVLHKKQLLVAMFLKVGFTWLASARRNFTC